MWCTAAACCLLDPQESPDPFAVDHGNGHAVWARYCATVLVVDLEVYCTSCLQHGIQGSHLGCCSAVVYPLSREFQLVLVSVLVQHEESALARYCRSFHYSVIDALQKHVGAAHEFGLVLLILYVSRAG